MVGCVHSGKLSVVFYGWSCIINGGLRLLICSTFLCLIIFTFFNFYFFKFYLKTFIFKVVQSRVIEYSSYLICRYGTANVWKMFTDLFDYFPLTALVSMLLRNFGKNNRVLFLLLIGVVIVCWLECHHFQLHVFLGLCNQNSEGFFLVVSVTPFWKKHTWYYYYFAL
jgi:hypothetical protein